MATSNRAAGRQCLLDQAQQLFFTHGYHGVSIRDIVQVCGLSNAALYYHFGSQENIFAEVIREFVAEVAGKVQEAGERGNSCRERLAGMAGAFLQIAEESRSELQTLLRDLTECEGEEIQQLIPEVVGKIPSLFASVLEEGIATGELRPVDARRVSAVVMGTINALAARRMHIRVDEPVADDIDLVIDILFEGIGA